MLKLQKQAAALEKAAADVTEELARHSFERAVRLSPVRTGNLRASIEQEKNRVFTFCPYAKAVEMGTLNRPGRPFLRPAMDEMLFRQRAEQRGKEAVT